MNKRRVLLRRSEQDAFPRTPSGVGDLVSEALGAASAPSNEGLWCLAIVKGVVVTDSACTGAEGIVDVPRRSTVLPASPDGGVRV